jgi:hypothetical protein
MDRLERKVCRIHGCSYINRCPECEYEYNHEKPDFRPGNNVQEWLDSLPPLPVHKSDCTCDICIGLKMCPVHKIRSMYLDKKRRVWVCIVPYCPNRFEAVVDPLRQNEKLTE